MRILITWTTSWIWNYLAKNLKNEINIIWVWRSENNIDGVNFIRWDLQDENFLEQINKNLIENIDYLIINSWVWYFDKFENIDNSKHKEIINTNLLSPILLINLLLKNKKINKWIIFIWSIAWKKSMKFWSSYSASKFWLRGFAMHLKNEFTKLKIHLVNPSIVKTNFHINSKIDIVWKYKENSLEEVLYIIKKILRREEQRFEIDL